MLSFGLLPYSITGVSFSGTAHTSSEVRRRPSLASGTLLPGLNGGSIFPQQAGHDSNDRSSNVELNDADDDWDLSYFVSKADTTLRTLHLASGFDRTFSALGTSIVLLHPMSATAAPILSSPQVKGKALGKRSNWGTWWSVPIVK